MKIHSGVRSGPDLATRALALADAYDAAQRTRVFGDAFFTAIRPSLEAIVHARVPGLDPNRVDDVVQDVVVKVLLRRPKAMDGGKFSRWVHVVTRNQALSELRKIKYERSLRGNGDRDLLELVEARKERRPPPTTAAHAALALATAQKLGGEKQRSVLTLRLTGLNVDEVAEKTNLPRQRVFESTTRAVDSVRRMLKIDDPDGFEDSDLEVSHSS